MTLEEQLNSKEKMYKDSYLFKRLYSYLKPELKQRGCFGLCI